MRQRPIQKCNLRIGYNCNLVGIRHWAIGKFDAIKKEFFLIFTLFQSGLYKHAETKTFSRGKFVKHYHNLIGWVINLYFMIAYLNTHAIFTASFAESDIS